MDIGVLKGSMGYWINNEDTYNSTGGAFQATQVSDGIINIGYRIYDRLLTPEDYQIYNR